MTEIWILFTLQVQMRKQTHSVIYANWLGKTLHLNSHIRMQIKVSNILQKWKGQSINSPVSLEAALYDQICLQGTRWRSFLGCWRSALQHHDSSNIQSVRRTEARMEIELRYVIEKHPKLQEKHQSWDHGVLEMKMLNLVAECGNWWRGNWFVVRIWSSSETSWIQVEESLGQNQVIWDCTDLATSRTY